MTYRNMPKTQETLNQPVALLRRLYGTIRARMERDTMAHRIGFVLLCAIPIIAVPWVGSQLPMMAHNGSAFADASIFTLLYGFFAFGSWFVDYIVSDGHRRTSLLESASTRAVVLWVLYWPALLLRAIFFLLRFMWRLAISGVTWILTGER